MARLGKEAVENRPRIVGSLNFIPLRSPTSKSQDKITISDSDSTYAIYTAVQFVSVIQYLSEPQCRILVSPPLTHSMTGQLTRTALVLYATETGTSQDLAEELSQLLERFFFDTDVKELDSVHPDHLSSYDLTVFVVPTTGQGNFPSDARIFWTNLRKKRLNSDYLSSVKYALVGLGDSSYPRFNWAARKLHKRLEQLGAREIVESCEADEQGDESTEGAFLAWCQSLRPALLAEFPPPNGKEPLSEATPLPRKRALARLNTELIAGFANGHGLVEHRQFPSSNPDIDERLVKDAVTAVLETNTRVTPKDHWQDVRLLTLTFKTSMSYLPGDSLAILPKNFHQDVDILIDLMDWRSIADEPIRLAQVANPGPISDQTRSDLPSTATTLRTLLSDYLDITAIPRRSFFAKIARHTSDEMHKERLLEFTEARYLDEYYDYATRPRRSILEVLHEFDSVKIPWEEVINIFPVMKQRQFSIASGGALKRNGDGTARVELLVAIVKYRTVIKKIRQGVCTRYLAALPVGSTLKVTLRTEGRFHMRPQDFLTPHILIGAGTGIAPLRALIYEKGLIYAKLGETGQTTLIFGSRSKNADYFFEEEWEHISSRDSSSTLRLTTAFSRDQKTKIYVQDRVREDGDRLFQWIDEEQAVIILCGSSGQMPKAVREALVDVIECGMKARDGDHNDGRKQAEEYLAHMEKMDRFKQETW